MTPEEYAAIGRRVYEVPAEGQFQCERDRAALWELCERLIADRITVDADGTAVVWRTKANSRGRASYHGQRWVSEEAARGALLESRGGDRWLSSGSRKRRRNVTIYCRIGA